MPHPSEIPTIPIGTKARLLLRRGGLSQGTTASPGVAGSRLEIRLDEEATPVQPADLVLVEVELRDLVLWFEGTAEVPSGTDGKTLSVGMPEQPGAYRFVTQRQSQRFPVQCDVDVTSADGTTVVRTKAIDLSAGGARIHFDAPIPDGQRLELLLHLAMDPRPVRIRATAVEQLESTLQPGRHIIRLAFDVVTEDAAARIAQHCARVQAEQKQHKRADS